MKSIREINQSYVEFEKISGINLGEVEQGSDEWLHTRLGVITASRAKDALLGSRGKRTQGSETYRAELVAEVINKESKKLSGKALDWGHNNELAARSIASFELGVKIKEVPFIFKDDTFRTGASPDGYGEQPIEIKCPYASENHVNTLTLGTIKPEYIFQMQYSMWVSGALTWLFASYDPRATKFQLVSKLVERDHALMRRFDDEIPLFIEEMDEMLSNIGLVWGSQWK